VGPPGTGKSTALRMLLRSQATDTGIVYLTHRSREQIERQLSGLEIRAPLTVIHTSAQDSLGARYLAPFCAMHIAKSLREKHRHVLLVVDDILAFAEAASDIRGGVPLSVSNVLGSLLDAAGCDKDGKALSVVAVVDLAQDEALPRDMQDLWRTIEPSLDVCVSFREPLAAKRIFPAIDVDNLMCGFAPPYQAPFMQVLRQELKEALSTSAELDFRLSARKQLGLDHEDDEKEDLISAEISRMLLLHDGTRSLPELAVLLCASLIFHFPAYRGGRLPPPAAIIDFQETALSAIRTAHPEIWETLTNLESMSKVEANELLQRLGHALMSHRFDFRLTRPEL